VSGVRALTGVPETDEWDSRISSWIAESDAAIEKRLGQTFSPAPSLITRLSNLLTAIIVLERLKAEGSLDSFTLGDYSERDPLAAVESAIKNYRAEAEEIFRLYGSPIVKSSSYQYIDEDDE